MKKINLLKGYVEIPDEAKVVNISEGQPLDVGILVDRDGILDHLVIVADVSLVGLTILETDWIIDKAIEKLSDYKNVKAMELPNPFSCKATLKNRQWDDSVRLRFYPIEAVNNFVDSNYHLYI